MNKCFYFYLFKTKQVTANRLPSMQSIRQNYYQYHPSSMMPNSAISRGRSLTPPSFKNNARLSSMNHLRTPDFYPPYYPPHSAVYPDSTYYRTYGDPYLMQRLPPPSFLPPVSPPSSSSHAYRNMYSSSGLRRYSKETSRKRTRQSRDGRRYEVRSLLPLLFLSSMIITIDSYIVLFISLCHLFSHNDHRYHRFVSR